MISFGSAGVAADGINFTSKQKKKQTKTCIFNSRHLVYVEVQLCFKFTLDTTRYVSREFNILGAGDIYPKL